MRAAVSTWPRTWILGCFVLMGASVASGGSITFEEDADTGWTRYFIDQDDTQIQVVPAAGMNVLSIQFQGRQLLRQPDTLRNLKGYMYGTPILYPTPNRVRDSRFTYEGKEYHFDPNDGANFLHGLACHAPFQVEAIDTTTDTAAPRIVASLDFVEGTPWFEKFPFRHKLIVEIEVRADRVRWTYTVDNRRGQKKVPYGFALHPWFLYQAERSKTFLTIPADNVMESVDLLPTGRLLPVEGSMFDARKGIPLEGFVVDDVYFGLRPNEPVRIDCKGDGPSIDLWASPEFTHLVVYTPNEPWFCVENQTCSADAHNLYSRGLTKESNLQFAEVGSDTTKGWVEFRFRP